jgi:superfamily II DNA or RNA helicase
VLPTGGGKTVIFCYITEQAGLKGKRVLILVHRRELLLQGSRNLVNCGVEHGIIAPGFTQNRLPVQVGSVQTVIRRLDRMDPPDLIIMDEGHHAAAATWEIIIKAYPKALYLGVTATPCRLDGRGLGRHVGGLYDAMILGPTIQQLTDQGYLSPALVYAPPSGVDMTSAHVSMGDYDRKEVVDIVDKPRVTGCAVTHYRKFCDGKPAIAFCASVDHAHHVAEEFRAAGYMAQAVDGTMKEADRDLAIKSLGNGQIQVLTACEIISEGVDVPIVECGILLRPTQSTGMFLQQVGRVLRPLPGKTAIILDHVGNCLRHGLPHDTREWSLDAPRQKRREPKDEDDIAIRQCPKCYFVHHLAPACPKCGYVYPKKVRKLEIVKGELKLLTSAQMRDRKRFIAKRIEQGKSHDLESLLNLAKQRKYNPQWAYHVYRERLRKEQAKKAPGPELFAREA